MPLLRYADLAAAVQAAPPRLGGTRLGGTRIGGTRIGGTRLGGTRLVAVDGRAGSGKTTFAGRLAGALTAAGAGQVPVVHTDDLLEGWTDLATYWPRLEQSVLRPLRAGQTGGFAAYDWEAGRFGDRWERVEAAPVVVLEGVASARAAVRPELTLAVWVELDPQRCLARGVARDGEALRSEWVAWQAREAEHFAADGTREAADLVVDGAPTVSHDLNSELLVISGAAAAPASWR